MIEAALDGTGAFATLVRDCLVVTVGADLGGGALDGLGALVDAELRSRPARAVVFDLGALRYLDGDEFATLRAIVRTVELLGLPAVLVGMRPGIIIHLTRCDIDTSGLRTALGLDEALESLGVLQAPARGR